VQLEDGRAREVIEITVHDGKNNRGGPALNSLILGEGGSSSCFNGITWYDHYVGVEERLRARMEVTQRPKVMFYNQTRKSFGRPLHPSTINSRFKIAQKEAGLVGTGLVAYGLKVMGVTTAASMSVETYRIKQFENWRSDTCYVYIADKDKSRLEVAGALAREKEKRTRVA
jgi:hypothetical protein